MKIVAHELNSKKYKGFLNALGLVNEVSVWDSNNKSIYDMDLEKEPDVIIIPTSIKTFDFLETSSEGVAQRAYRLDVDFMPTSANLFPKGKYNTNYASDILILPEALDHIYNFSFLLYPNQSKYKVKVISQIPFPIAEYIGYGNINIISDHIASTKLVICTDMQTDMNMRGIDNVYVRNVVDNPMTIEDVDGFFDYYHNYNLESKWFKEREEYNIIKKGLTYYHRAIEFYEGVKNWGLYDKEMLNELIKITNQKIKEYL